MTQEAEIILSNLSKYPLIHYFLGDITRQRLDIEGYQYGILTASLFLANDEFYDNSDLDRLENALEIGKRHCTNFYNIFQNISLSQKWKVAEGQIADILAEVKGVEILDYKRFINITKIKREQSAKTVDFSAIKNNQNYAIEVTRLGLAKSDRKKPKLNKLSRLPLLTIIDSKEPENVSRIEEDVYGEITDKYPQIKNFCQRESGIWKGILIISNGRDYFLGRHENKLYELQTSTVPRVATQVWETLEESEIDYEYLHHIMITMSKYVEKAFIHPKL